MIVLPVLGTPSLAMQKSAIPPRFRIRSQTGTISSKCRPFFGAACPKISPIPNLSPAPHAPLGLLFQPV